MTTQKRNALIYWIATIWLGFAMVASGLQQVMHGQAFTEIFTHLGYPLYFMPMVGLYKLVSVVILFSPRQPLLKEWSYFGTALIWIGAIISHFAVGDTVAEAMPAIVLFLMTGFSWHFRPASKKLMLV